MVTGTVLVTVAASVVAVRGGVAYGWALLVLPGLVLVLWARSERLAGARIANLQALYDFARLLSGLTDSDEIIRVALTESARILGAGGCELRLPPAAGGLRCYIDEAGGLGRDLDEPGAMDERVATAAGAILEPGASVVAVPVPLGDLGVAVLTAREPPPRARRFDREDVRLLEALGACLATAFTSSQRLDWLRLEVASREHQALHDSLTGLANRTLFGQMVAQSLESRRSEEKVAVMLMDLDGFKDINDTLGHHTGDRVLEIVAERVRSGLAEGSRAARLGGDEFAVVLPAVVSPDEIMNAVRQLHSAVSRPVSLEGMDLEVRASIGVALAPDNGTDLSTLLRRADVAMYSAKRTRLGVAVYDPELDAHARRRLVLANDLRQAMRQGHLEIWYQPIARPGTGEVTGMEALLRWRHPEYGSIAPAEFIPVAEQSGLIEPITWWVLRSSLSELATWRREGYELTMAVNFSARSLSGPHVADRLRRLLDEAGLPAADLTLEITESLMMADPQRSQRVLEQLDQLGVRIAIDDFGTGWSSLSRLRHLPVDTVKIDRSFVMAMHRDQSDEAIVRTTIELARNMGHEVVAEGVERQDTWDRLIALGCDQVQGYLLAPAMPVETCRPWLRARQSPGLAAVQPLRGNRGA